MTPLERLEAERYPTRGDTYLARRRAHYTNTRARAAAFTAALRHQPAEEWWERAACAGIYDPDVFYPASAHPAAATVALDYCHRCPVRVDCLATALHRDELGVWGGTTEEQRKRLRERRSA